jgi:hypothetical protein
MKYLTLFLQLVFLISCKSSDKKVDFKGVWIDKQVLESKGTIENDPTQFPLVLIEDDLADSLLIYFDSNNKYRVPTEFAYESYFVHVDKNTEYFLIPDIDKEELVFSNLKDKVFRRFVRVDSPLSRNDILDSNFRLEHFIQTLN